MEGVEVCEERVEVCEEGGRECGRWRKNEWRGEGVKVWRVEGSEGMCGPEGDSGGMVGYMERV